MTKKTKKTFTCCPHCGYTSDNAKAQEVEVGGKRFGSNIVAIAAVVTGIKARDIKGKPRALKFSHARVAALAAMRSILSPTGAPTSWDDCGAAVGRDRGAAFRLFSTWQHDETVKANAAKIVASYQKQVAA